MNRMGPEAYHPVQPREEVWLPAGAILKNASKLRTWTRGQDSLSQFGSWPMQKKACLKWQKYRHFTLRMNRRSPPQIGFTTAMTVAVPDRTSRGTSEFLERVEIAHARIARSTRLVKTVLVKVRRAVVGPM